MTVTARDELEFRVQGEFEGTTIVTGPLDGDDDDLQNNEGSNSGGEGEGSTTDLPNALSDGGSADSGSGENSSAGYDIDSNGDNADGQEIGTTTTIRNGDWDIGIEDKSLISTTVNQSVSDGKWRITGGTSIVDISSRSWNDVFFWTHVTISADQFHVTVESTIDSYSDSGFGLFTTSQLDANAANAYLDSQDDSEQLDGGNNEESDSPNGQTQSISDGGSQSGDVDHAPNSPGAPTPSDYADQTSPLDASSTGSGSSDAINDPSSLVDTSSGSSNGDGNTDGQPNDGQPNGGDSIDEGDAPDNLWQIVSGSAYAYANIDDFVSFDMDGTFWDYSDPEITIDGGFGNNVSDHLKIGRRVDSIWGDPDSDPAAVFDADGENTDGNDTSNDDTSSDSDWVTWGSGHFSLDSEAGSYYFLDVLFSGSDEDTSYTGGMHIYTDDSYVSRLWTMESLAAGTADDDNQWQFDGGGGFATITSNLFTHTHVDGNYSIDVEIGDGMTISGLFGSDAKYKTHAFRHLDFVLADDATPDSVADGSGDSVDTPDTEDNQDSAAIGSIDNQSPAVDNPDSGSGSGTSTSTGGTNESSDSNDSEVEGAENEDENGDESWFDISNGY
ncbi:MAG: hypothetical protein AAFN70_08410, partial [Planctomycetota bacterium]